MSERPSADRTWSLRGQAPVFSAATWKQLSAIAGLSFSQFQFRLFPGAIRSNLCLDTIDEIGRFARNRLKSMQRTNADHRVPETS